MINLGYRVVTQPVSFWTEYNNASEIEREVDLIRIAPKIRLDNVLSFVTDSERYETILVDDFRTKIPNWAPPFPCFWAEATSHAGPDWEQVGCLFESCDISKFRCDQKKFDGFANAWAGQFCNEPNEITANSRWIVSLHFFSSGKENNGRPFRHSTCIYLLVDSDGKATNYRTISSPNEPEGGSLGCLWTFVVGLGVSFMHCKNVRQLQRKEEACPRFHQQYAVKKFTYRTLCIDPMKETLRTEGRSDTVGIQRALHICRGHFAAYTEEKPLFGKYPGVFFVPDHMRGSRDRGEVKKNYAVNP